MGNNLHRPKSQNKQSISNNRYKTKENKQVRNNNLFDPRRIIFVSLIGLFKTYKKCTPYILSTSLIIVPLKKQSIYTADLLEKNSNSNFISCLNCYSHDKMEIKNFIEFLKWKDSQGCVFWTLDDYENGFWECFSKRLSSLYDPITRAKYKPIELDSKWWHKSYTFSKYGTNLTSILNELYFVTAKYKTMQEIIYQSNPKSLLPVTFYGVSTNCFINDISLLQSGDSDDEDSLDLKDWYISTDYDPHDL